MTKIRGNGYQIEFLDSDAQPFSPYYDPRTGKVYERLPADPYSVSRYRARGLRIGRPPGGMVFQSQASDTPPQLDRTLLQRLAELEAEVARLRGEEPKEEPEHQLKLL